MPPRVPRPPTATANKLKMRASEQEPPVDTTDHEVHVAVMGIMCCFLKILLLENPVILHSMQTDNTHAYRISNVSRLSSKRAFYFSNLAGV